MFSISAVVPKERRTKVKSAMCRIEKYDPNSNKGDEVSWMGAVNLQNENKY
jgi:hypothetical protein